MMDGKLTAEQLKKIEENRQKALLRRQQSQLISNASLNNLTSTGPITYLAFAHGNQAHNILSRAGNQNGSSAVNKALPSKPPEAKIEALCVLMTGERFRVQMPYHDPSITLMKSINGRIFDQATKSWTFPIKEHDSIIAKFRTLPNLTIKGLPRNVINCFKVPPADSSLVDISKVDETLLRALMPFQAEGVRFGVSRGGRCLIADEMGLGKTLQALGIAHYYIDHWPLLILCPSSMRFPWEQAIIEFLPSVNPFNIVVMTTATDQDESHYIKNCKSARTEAAFAVSVGVPHVILLSGTPALSRPQELFPQLKVIDPSTFHNFHEFGVRYCDGKLKKYGWDFSGCSNSIELEILMKGKLMIRRMKAQVLGQMPSKIRKIVNLKPNLEQTISKQMEGFASQVLKGRGMDQRSAMLQWFSASASIKLPVVIDYLDGKLSSGQKILVFCHHQIMMDGIAVMLTERRVNFIRIEGSTSSEVRSRLCEEFQTCPSITVALLSLKAANAGITLTAAQLVVFAELYWNPGELTQAEDRAHRIGQSETVFVEYLVVEGTADDYMIKLVGDKLNVLNRCGLSKENFKSMETSSKENKRQLTLSNFLDKSELPNSEMKSSVITEKTAHSEPNKCFDSRETVNSSELRCSQLNGLFSVSYDNLEDGFTEDDIFENVDLAGIEEEYQSGSKRQRLDS